MQKGGEGAPLLSRRHLVQLTEEPISVIFCNKSKTNKARDETQ